MSTVNYKILAADDDPSILRLLINLLRKPGIQLEVVTNGRDALDAIEQNPPDVLITDWDMPAIDGLELCRRTRSLQLPHYVYILFLTAKSAPYDVVAGFDAGADDYVTKPIIPSELLARLRAGTRFVGIEKKLRNQAKTDPLTGLATKPTFSEHCAKEISRVRRHGGDLSCVMLDVDFFKRVNDVHGHAVGDNVLTAIAQAIRDECREADFACRYGGEEFCVLLIEAGKHEATSWAERARRAICDLRFSDGETEISVSASLGITSLLDDVVSPAELIDQADQALQVAKNAGRDRVVHFADLSRSGDIPSNNDYFEEPFQELRAHDVMTTPVACLSGTDSVRSAVDFFLRFRISSTPVVDDEGCMIGILSEKDCIAIMHRPRSWQMTVAEVMRPNVVCYNEDTPVKLIYDFFCRVSIRRVIIVKDRRPVGVISRGTLLRWYSHWTNRRLHNAPIASVPAVSRAHVQQMADFLAEEAASVRDKLRSAPEFTVPVILDGATRIQELTTNLLAASRTEMPPGYDAMNEMPIL